MLSAKLLSCLAVVSAIVMASCEAHAEVAEPDEGSKVLTSPGSAISQHDTTRSLRTSDAAVAKANEERVELTPVVAEAAEEAMIAPFHDISTAVRHNAAGLDNKIPSLLNDYHRHMQLAKQEHDVEAEKAYNLKKKLLSKEQGQLMTAFEKALSNQRVEVFINDHGMSKEVAVILLQVMKTEHDLNKLQLDYLHEKVRFEHQFRQKLIYWEDYLFGQGGEGLVRDADKSKAAAGAHAGTDHAAV